MRVKIPAYRNNGNLDGVRTLARLLARRANQSVNPYFEG